jgi:hypothetical protein
MKHLYSMLIAIAAVAVTSCSNNNFSNSEIKSNKSQSMEVSALKNNEKLAFENNERNMALISGLKKKINVNDLSEARNFIHKNYPDVDSIVIMSSATTGDKAYYVSEHSSNGVPNTWVVTSAVNKSLDKNKIEEMRKHGIPKGFTYKKASDMKIACVIK